MEPINVVLAKTLFHGTIRDHAKSIDKLGIWPSAGSFVEEMYGDDVDADDMPELVFMADKQGINKAVTAMMFQIYRKLGKGWVSEVTEQDIRNHGALCIIREVDDGDYSQRPEDGDDHGEYPVTVEPGDYYGESSVGVDTILTGPALIRYIKRFGIDIDRDNLKSATDELTKLAVRHHGDKTPDEVRKKIADLKPEGIRESLRYYRKLYSGASLLVAAAVRIEALHFTDFLGQPFEEFRQKYQKIAKQGGSYGLYVQFTNHASDPLERNPHATPDHSDPVGVYGYPIQYVLRHPADVWYGQGAKYLRVLESKAKHGAILDLQTVTWDDAVSYIASMGIKKQDGSALVRADDIEKWMKVVAKANKARLGGAGNKDAKLFFCCAQQKGPGSPEVISGLEQTARFKRLGFRALLDEAKSQKQAVINPREPEQIIFLDRSAFGVLETINLRGETRGIGTTFDTEVLDRPTAAKIATIIGDTLTGESERSNLGGWTYWWTKKGRRIELSFEQSRRHMDYAWEKLKLGEKKHKTNKLWTPHEASAVVRTELGEMRAAVGENEKLAVLLDDIEAQWEALQREPQPTDWVADSKKAYEEKVNKDRSDWAEQENNKRYKKAAEEFRTDIWPLFEKLGVGIQTEPDIDLDQDTMTGLMAKKIQMLHGLAVDNPDQQDAILQTIEDPEDGSPFLPYLTFIRTKLWPALLASYQANPEALRSDYLRGPNDEPIGSPKYLDSWLKFVVGTRTQ